LFTTDVIYLLIFFQPLRSTTENESANEGIRSRGRNLSANESASFNNSHSLHFFLAAWPVVGIWFTALGISTMLLAITAIYVIRVAIKIH
jgi:hypothetical protein